MTMEYELYRWDRDDLGGYVTVYVEKDSVKIEDITFGESCKLFWGKEEHEYSVTVHRVGVVAILAHVGMPVDGGPTEALGAWLATHLAGCSQAATQLKELAESAGVGVREFLW